MRLWGKTEPNPLEADFGIRHESGWVGAFTRRDVEGAIPAGTRIRKVVSEEGDGNPVGTRGIVLGSMPKLGYPWFMYFVQWDHLPRRAVACPGFKIDIE